MPFHILFRGLINHCSDGSGETAIFPEVPQHDLRLVVTRADVVDHSLTEDPLERHTNSEANPGINDPTKMSLLIAGKRLTISGIASSVRDTTTFFRKYLPVMKDVATCAAAAAPRPEILSRTIVPGAIGGYFDHPAGLLSIDDFFPKMAVYGTPPKLKCVARTVHLTLSPSGSSVKIGDGTQEIELKSNATVLFINADALGAAGLTNAHFPHYAQLLGQGCQVQAPVEDLTADCPLPHPKDFHFPGTACGNTQGPPPP